MTKEPRICPRCKSVMEERTVTIQYEKGKPVTDTYYVCRKGSCNGVFLPESIFGVHP